MLGPEQIWGDTRTLTRHLFHPSLKSYAIVPEYWAWYTDLASGRVKA